MKEILDNEYKGFLYDIKERIHKAQYEALKQVNKTLLALIGYLVKASSKSKKNMAGGRR